MQGKAKEKKDRDFFSIDFLMRSFSRKKKSFIPFFSNFSEMERKEATTNLVQVHKELLKKKLILLLLLLLHTNFN